MLARHAHVMSHGPWAGPRLLVLVVGGVERGREGEAGKEMHVPRHARMDCMVPSAEGSRGPAPYGHLHGS
jgi:hypothetical protein